MTNYSDILKQPHRPTIGVVVGSGGPKSAAAVELFAFLESAEIPVDYLFGCSGGAIVCSAKAVGKNPEEIRQIFSSLKKDIFQVDYKALLGLFNIPFCKFSQGLGILKKQPLLDIFKNILGEDTLIENTKIPLTIQTTDLDTGQGVYLKKGSLHKAVYASSAAVPFLPPIYIDGRWYVDGCFSSALPVLPAVSRGVDIIIAIDVQPHSFYHQVFQKQDKDFIEYYDSFILMSGANSTRFQNSLAVDQHHHEIVFIDIPFDYDIPIWRIDLLPHIFQRGKEAVEKAKEQILDAITSFTPRTDSTKIN